MQDLISGLLFIPRMAVSSKYPLLWNRWDPLLFGPFINELSSVVRFAGHTFASLFLKAMIAEDYLFSLTGLHDYLTAY
jgi:hypothetical protein